MNSINIYLYDDMVSLKDDFIAENLINLPKFRQEQCNRFRQYHDKRNCILAYTLLMQGLKEQYGITDPISFVYNEYGKPYLYEYPHIFFNISHCKSGVVCALAEIEIGIDIQCIRPFDWKVAQRVCSKSELLLLKEADNPEHLFCKLWTRKEAYAKSTGVCLSSVFQTDFTNFEKVGFETWEEDDYCISFFSRYL